MGDKTKHCPRCGRDLPLKDFGLSNTRSDKKQGHCLRCRSGNRKRESVAELSALAESNMYPAMYKYLADELGVTVESLKRVHVGYLPIGYFTDFEEEIGEHLEDPIKRFWDGLVQ